MKNCVNCGHELDDEMVFCPECGAALDGGENPESEENVVSDDYFSWYERDIFHAVLSPLINSFDNGRFFLKTSIVIIDIIVTSFLLSQPYEAYQLYKDKGLQGLTSADKTVELIFAITGLIIAIISFGYWMKRIDRIRHLINPKDEFVVIPLGTFLFQWLGEWIALVLGVGGIFAIILSLFDVHTSSFVLTLISNYGLSGGIYALLISIIIVFVFRLIAENIRAFAAIANNTSRIRNNDITEDYEDDYSNDTYFNILYIICIVVTILFMIAAMNQ